MKAIYNRCSTDKQDFDQQMQCINQYLQRINETDELVHVVEKVSGSVKHTERKLDKLLKQCDKGSVIYVSELSRLGRNMSDLFSIVSYAGEHDITIIQCKDETVIENKSIGGKALLFALSLSAEIELENIRQRTKMGLAARKAKGLPTGGACRKSEVDTSKAVEASAKSRREKAKNNPKNVFFWQFCLNWQKKNGKFTAMTDFQPIADELNSLGQTTATGLPFTKNRVRAAYQNLSNFMI